ncbi:MAG: CoA-binding protein [Syntrophobacteraceae bacterium]
MTQNRAPESAASDQEVKAILERAKTIAVVGISHKEERDSYKVAKYLKDNGYAMIPVNPKYKEVMGEKCYPDLKSVPVHIDIVDIFRNIEAIPAIVDEAIAVGASCVWMQIGLAHEEAAEKARRAGLSVVMDKCAKVEHAQLILKPGTLGLA